MLFLTAAAKKRLYAPAFLENGFLRDLHEREPFRSFFERSRQFPGINQDLYLDLKTYLADDIMVKVDRMSMAASLETRAPLLDYKLVEFAFSLPPGLEGQGRHGQMVLQKSHGGHTGPDDHLPAKGRILHPHQELAEDRSEGADARDPVGKKAQGHGLFFTTPTCKR